MSNLNTNSHRGFSYSIIGLLLIVNILIYSHLNTILIIKEIHYEVVDSVVALFTIATFIISVVGLIKSIKGIKEPNTIKKVIGLIINAIIIGLFITFILVNVIDIYKAFY